MPTTNPKLHDIRLEESYTELGINSGNSLQGLARIVDNRLTKPLEITISGNFLNVSASTRQKLQSDGTMVGTTNSFIESAPPLNGSVPVIAASTLNVTSGAVTGDFEAAPVSPTMTASWYVYMGLEVRVDNKIYVVFGAQAVSSGTATKPSFTKKAIPMGYILLQDDGSGGTWNFNAPVITNLSTFGSGGGGGGGGTDAWATSTMYNVGDIIYFTDNNFYRCLTGHTSGTFGTDFSSGYWQQMDVPSIIASTNFITNSTIENGTTGYNIYFDAAGTRPVDGTGTTGGTPTITLAKTTTAAEVLSGYASLRMDKTAINSQGQGFSVDFAIDNANKGKVQAISFDYMINSGTYNDGDMIVDIYDITNGVIIEPVGISLYSASTGLSSQFYATFQTNTNSASYRLIFHIASSTNTSAWSISFDNISVGPQLKSNGIISTDIVSYTPIFSTGSGTPTNYTTAGKWYRLGDKLKVTATIAFSGAIGTFSGLRVSIPSGLSIDTSKISASGTQNLGSFISNTGSSPYCDGIVAYFNTTTLTMYKRATPAVSNPTTMTFANAANTDFTTNSAIDIDFEVPIVGWSSNTTLSSDATGRKVSMSANGPNGTLNGSYNIVKFGAKQEDTTGSYDTSTGIYTVPESGDYSISSIVHITETATAGSDTDLAVFKNGSELKRYQYLYQANTTGKTIPLTLSLNSFPFVKGDTIDVRVACSGSSPSYAYANTAQHNLSISKLQSPQVIAGIESVSAKYINSAGNTITDNVATWIDFPTKLWDSHNAVLGNGSGNKTTNGATFRYVAPYSGKYFVKCALNFNVASIVAGNESYLELRVNNIAKDALWDTYYMATTSQPTNYNGSTEVDLLMGDVVELVFLLNLNAGPYTQTASALYNYIIIERRGN